MVLVLMPQNFHKADVFNPLLSPVSGNYTKNELYIAKQVLSFLRFQLSVTEFDKFKYYIANYNDFIIIIAWFVFFNK